MAKIGGIAQQDQEYYKSGRWKCPGHGDKPSPTGSHHWLEVSRSEAAGLFYCKYCFDVRRFYVTWSEADKRQKLKEVKQDGELRNSIPQNMG